MSKTWAYVQESLSYCNLYKMEGEKVCQSCDNFNCKHSNVKNCDLKIEKIWDEFGDIPMDEDENLEYDYFIWKKGDNKYEIWEWFDEFHSKGVAYLVNDRDDF